MRYMFSIGYNPWENKWVMYRRVEGGEWSAIGSVKDAELRHMIRHYDADSGWDMKDVAGIAYGYMAARLNVFGNASGGFERLR